MKPSWIFAWRLPVFVLAVLALAPTFAADSGWHLLRPGNYHEGEAPPHPGGGWLALQKQGGVWQLVPAHVHVKMVPDMEEPPPGKHGVEISGSPAHATVWLQHPGLQPGPVASLKFACPQPGCTIYSDSPPLKLQYAGSWYQLQANGNRLVLHEGDKRAVLKSVITDDIVVGDRHGSEEIAAMLLWAGDIDGDGHLDLLMEYNSYNSWEVCLYLSSLAKQGQSVGRAACQGGVGC